MNLRARLERLERLEDLAGGSVKLPTPRHMERLLHAFENARRELEGRELLPDLPYTEEDASDDRRFIEEAIPAYREGQGWQTEEARTVLEHWQRQTEERLKGA
jgi:hypothetical protein